MTRPIASSSVHQHLDDRLAHDDDVVERDLPLEAGREVLLEAIHLGDHALEHLDGIGRRQQRNADALRLEAEEAQVRRVGFGAELDAADVLDADQRAVRAGLDDDVFELGRLRQAAHRAHADRVVLLGRRRRVAERAGGDLHVLLAQRADHVAGGDVAAGQLGRIEPQPHRELALAEHDHVADARHALDRVADVEVDVVADELARVAVVAREEPETADEAGRHLRDRDAVLPHLGRHAAERLVDAVLHVDGGEILIAIDVERHRDGGEAAVGARRGDVAHALDAVDRLLERRGHGALDGLRVGAGVERRHGHRRRRQLGIARDRQRRNRHRARENDQQRADRREDGPADKDVGNHDGALGACA